MMNFYIITDVVVNHHGDVLTIDTSILYAFFKFFNCEHKGMPHWRRSIGCYDDQIAGNCNSVEQRKSHIYLPCEKANLYFSILTLQLSNKFSYYFFLNLLMRSDTL